MAGDDTAADVPLYYIATQDLYITGPGGPVRAFAPGDHVPPAHVERFGWQDGVEVPGDDEPGPPPAAPPAGGGAEDGAATPAAGARAGAPPAPAAPAPSTSTPSDGGQPAERTTTP